MKIMTKKAMRINKIKREIMRLVYIHRQLKREWTGISIDGKRESINPHTEKLEVLQEVLSLLLIK